MKLPLGITLALFLILQTFQQASTQIPEDWERNNGTTGDKGKQPHSEEITAKPTGESKEDIQSNVDAQANPESGTENEGQPFGTFNYSEGGEQNSTKLDLMPEQSVADTEEASSEGPIATTTPPPMIALNSSSELSDTSAESNETLTQDTDTSTPEPEHTNESTLIDTYTSPQPETTTTESSHDESGSGYLPSDDVPTNSTTKSPTTTTKDESVQNKTTVSPTEPPVHRTTTAVIPLTVSKDVTTPAPDSEDTNQTKPTDTRGNSERGLSSDVSDVTESKKGQAWTVVLVIGIIVGVLALGAFIILNQRNKKDFSHRKLVEEMSPDPVLRLDNSEPLDLKFDGFGYYNPGLQGDNIQMTNFPQGHSK
ncbi:mucin-15-like [Sinocyclocheilus anshuiensis]|uniref:Mucin-15-like n=1 Tax=Sinocyclocheilus anshuiensis TaxID=1608454 RepID=A0A671RCZ2_9TELE|nr:PREDICTED: mucin-15-like [Sinocyclocheilus anshuiensis]XP_016310412.1 PREDICTED: mucin-15-like [Sinocyclocheilus anshuiensis]